MSTPKPGPWFRIRKLNWLGDLPVGVVRVTASEGHCMLGKFEIRPLHAAPKAIIHYGPVQNGGENKDGWLDEYVCSCGKHIFRHIKLRHKPKAIHWDYKGTFKVTCKNCLRTGRVPEHLKP